jgi:hypothetical protein
MSGFTFGFPQKLASADGVLSAFDDALFYLAVLVVEPGDYARDAVSSD